MPNLFSIFKKQKEKEENKYSIEQFKCDLNKSIGKTIIKTDVIYVTNEIIRISLIFSDKTEFQIDLDSRNFII